MNKTVRENMGGDSPPVIRFQARLFRNPETAKNDSPILLSFPKWVSEKYPARGMTKVEGTINGHPFRAALEPNAPGSHWLRVNQAMLNGASVGAGDTVQLAILGPEPEPRVPSDLRAALDPSQEAKMLWKDLTPTGRRDWIRWIESAKKPETRARRVRRTIEQLAEGKRRPCCVNVYEFMLCRVDANRSRRKRAGGPRPISRP